MILYDADCGVCRWLLAKILTWDRAANLRPVALQSDEARQLLAGVPEDRWMSSWHLVDREGVVHSAGDAFEVLLPELPGGRALVPAVRAGRRPLNAGYDWFAANRSHFGRRLPSSWKRRAKAKIAARS